MHFLTPSQWQKWCLDHSVPLRESGWLRPDIRSDGFHSVDLPYPKDSGKKVFLAHQLLSLVNDGPEALILIDDWSVWPSCQHLPLFTRFRESIGENRPLIEAPGHLVTATESDDAVSIIATALFFMWDCYGISSTGRNAFFVSHDEYGFFVSRDPSVAEKVSTEFSAK